MITVHRRIIEMLIAPIIAYQSLAPNDNTLIEASTDPASQYHSGDMSRWNTQYRSLITAQPSLLHTSQGCFHHQIPEWRLYEWVP